MAYIAKRATRLEARYTPEGGLERCGYCRHFVSQGSCNRIIGPVSPRGWCKYFSQQVTHSVLDPGGAMAGSASWSPPGLTLNLDFTTGVMPVGVTFTRASTATYFSSVGVMQTAAVNAPRFDYNPSTLALNGLLIEEARTNMETNSASLTSWSKLQATLTGASGVAPDGTNTMLKLAEDASNNFHTAINSYTITGATVYTFSVFAKAVENRFLILGLDDGAANGLFADFDLVAGTFTQQVSGTAAITSVAMQSIGGGIYRCILTGATNSTTNGRAALTLAANNSSAGFPSYQGVAGHGLLVWGLQFEAGAFPTSYIPTSGSTVTRSQEQAIIPIAGWYTAGPCSIVVNAMWPFTPPANCTLMDLNDGSNANRLVLFNRSPIYGQGISGNVGSWLTGIGTPSVGQIFKVGITSAPGSQNGALNGAAVVPLAAAPLPVGITRLSLGVNVSSASPLDGYLMRLLYWPRALSPTELQAVTT